MSKERDMRIAESVQEAVQDATYLDSDENGTSFYCIIPNVDLAAIIATILPDPDCFDEQAEEQERVGFEADTLETYSVATFGRFPTTGRYNTDWIENRWDGWKASCVLRNGNGLYKENYGINIPWDVLKSF